MEPWLVGYSRAAERSDAFRGRRQHRSLLAVGFFGEAGSVLAEVKKKERERAAYPAYLDGLSEELGDFLWYFVRLVAECDPTLLHTLPSPESHVQTRRSALSLAVSLGATAGRVLSALDARDPQDLRMSLFATWNNLIDLVRELGISLHKVALSNLAKTQSRWPTASRRLGWPKPRDYYPVFDEQDRGEEKLPRSLEVTFLERDRGSRKEVVFRCNGLNIGDRINDNIADPDFYRFHDIFHLSYAVFVGWSPIVRSIFRCKRKNKPGADENQDGARAGIIEETISALVFSRAKHLHYFRGIEQVDYDLLKSINVLVRGYEVDKVPVWQWERAIIEGFRVFRKLKDNGGGVVSWSIPRRTLKYVGPILGEAPA